MHRRAIIVHNLEHAKAALTAAGRLGTAVTLRSAPGAAAYLGAAVFRRIIDEAAQACPGVAFTAVLDCGQAPGSALGALRHGVEGVRVAAPPEVRAKIASVAARTGAFLDDGAGESLDLLRANDAVGACLAWLENGRPE